MCNCQTMARDLSETMGGKYPASLHAPLCEDYQQVPFTRIGVDGSGCIVPESVAAAVIAGRLLTGGVGYVAGSLVGVLILGVIQSLIAFDGTLSSWWTRIAIGVLLCLFCLMQRLLERGSSNFSFLFSYWKKPVEQAK